MKQYIDLVKGQLVFADLLHVTNTFAPVVSLSRTQKGIDIVRWSAKQLVNTRLSQPGCDDGCLTTPFVRKYDFSATGQLPATPAELATMKAELKQFFADLEVLITSGALQGVKPSVATTFPSPCTAIPSICKPPALSSKTVDILP